jgi:hypothetical protein
MVANRGFFASESTTFDRAARSRNNNPMNTAILEAVFKDEDLL